MLRRGLLRCVAAAVSAALVSGCGTPDDAGREPGVTVSGESTGTSAATGTPTIEPPTGTPTEDFPDGPPPAQSSSPDAGPAPPAASWPAYEFSVEPVTAERLGPTWREGCPVGPDELRLVRLRYATPDGASAAGELIVAAELVDDIAAAFGDLYEARFPITRMQTIDAYGGDDDLSMAADNTSAFNCREVTGGTGWSRHAFGAAVDINPLRNPYVLSDAVLPPAGEAYLDRSNVRPGMIVADDLVVEAFTSRGFKWGGDFRTSKDYQHFAR